MQLIFLDVETTGVSATGDRIIEIALIKTRSGKIIDRFTSLVNPETKIGSFITKLTGISDKHVKDAPKFSQIHEQVTRFIGSSIVVAYNAEFDIGFLSAELSRVGSTGKIAYCCSVKVSRDLYPSFRKHSLDSLIERFNMEVESRHRVYDDALLIHKFFEAVKIEKSEDALKQAIGFRTKHTTITRQKLQVLRSDLPESSGVYIFRDTSQYPLYIGKIINIKHRVQQHFGKNESGVFSAQIKQKIRQVDYILTAGELGALIRESILIKKLFPLYNQLLRQGWDLLILRHEYDRNGYITLKKEEVKSLAPEDFNNFYGIFRSEKQIEAMLTNFARVHRLCHKYLRLEKTNGACFASQLGICDGACKGLVPPEEYNLRLNNAFADYSVRTWPYTRPIIVTEEGNGLQEKFLINHWCLLRSNRPLTNDENETIPENFDMDIYRLMVKFMRSGKVKVTSFNNLSAAEAAFEN